MPTRPEFRYCPACGGPLEAGGLCARCGEVRQRRPTPAVAVAVVEGSEILLVKRRYAPMVGHWALPAGYLEGHEDPWKTARREALELPEEKALAERLEAATATATAALEREAFDEAMMALAGLRGPVDEFFDRVTVNTDKPELRENRLRLLSEIRATLNRVADFSQIEG